MLKSMATAEEVFLRSPRDFEGIPLTTSIILTFHLKKSLTTCYIPAQPLGTYDKWHDVYKISQRGTSNVNRLIWYYKTNCNDDDYKKCTGTWEHKMFLFIYLVKIGGEGSRKGTFICTKIKIMEVTTFNIIWTK